MKSKLLTFPGGRFSTNDEGERARYGAYALFRRAAERPPSVTSPPSSSSRPPSGP